MRFAFALLLATAIPASAQDLVGQRVNQAHPVQDALRLLDGEGFGQFPDVILVTPESVLKARFLGNKDEVADISAFRLRTREGKLLPPIYLMSTGESYALAAAKDPAGVPVLAATLASQCDRILLGRSTALVPLALEIDLLLKWSVDYGRFAFRERFRIGQIIDVLVARQGEILATKR